MTSETAFSTAYLLHGMKRSGNHALVCWLLPQIDALFVNNAIPLGPILRGLAVMPDPVPFDVWCAERGRPKECGERDFVVSLEDHALSVTPFLERGVRLRRLLILRRAEQMFSSRLRHAAHVDMRVFPRRNDNVMQRVVSVWKQHARCFLGMEDDVYPGRIAISFEAWVTDGNYRRALCDAMEIEFDDRAFGKVGRQGGGSSFDGMSFDGKGHLMNVLDRVSQLVPGEREVLDEILQDSELQDLSDLVQKADPYRQIQMVPQPHEYA